VLPDTPKIVAPGRAPTAHWRWPIGPGGQPPSEMQASPRGATAAGTALQPRDSGPWPHRVTPSLASTSGGKTPAASSPQEAAFGANQKPSPSGLLPPTRSVEPWTTEEWIMVYEQPTDRMTGVTDALLMGKYGRYFGDARFGEHAQPWMPTSPDVASYPSSRTQWTFYESGIGMQAHFAPKQTG